MPNIWTHKIFAERIAEKARLDFTKYHKVFTFGAQGPDPFFYHHFWPWKKKHSFDWIGSKLHSEHCGLFLIEMIKYVKQHPDDWLLKSYVFGFISHHILDRNAHPYIHFKAGNDGKRHTYLEVLIDTLLMKHYYKIDTWRTPVYPQIDIGYDLPSSIQNMLVHLLKEVHEIDISNLNQVINQSYQDMKGALNFLYDPNGIKKRLLGKQVSFYTYAKEIPNKDILNVNHNDWLHPTNEKEVSTDSFFDILQRAEEEGVEIFQAIENYLTGMEADIQLVEQLIGDISYDTGKACDPTIKLTFFEPII